MPARLKSLELQGYKTFASRTVFAFSDRITAIVGPNGSGKSNIADSMRWVLGEQSYALLRGRKTEDMIFSGSEHRPRAGMASATITFDNCDGWLPIDYSEVAITRRAYRDGQNEYLINRQRVRLKDVSELLAQSGLAERTYTIIGQGLVDAALALKAEERRRLFEEAAGTSLHRARREEALRRLETTSRNLERVQDILAELQPRLRSLERQARRAQEYEQVKADLRVLLREWYGYHWHLTQKELREAREAVRVQERNLERARQEQTGQDEQLSALRGKIQELRLELNGWHRQSAEVHTRREATSRELAVAEERRRSIEAQQQNIQAELARLEADIALAQERSTQAEAEASRLDTELGEAQAQVRSSREELEQRQGERQRGEAELESARQALGELANQQTKLHARLAELQSQGERIRQTIQAADKAREQAEREQHAAAQRSEAAQEDLTAAAGRRQAAEEALQECRQRIDLLEAQRLEAREQHSAAAAEVARLRAELGVLEQAENALSGYSAGTRLLLQAARQEKLHGATGALGTQLDVPEEYEAAISAALGEYLDAIALEEGEDEALDLLKEAAARGVLLPLKALRPQIPFFLDGDQDGVIGLAAGMVRAAESLKPAVDLLLGNVVIVRDRAAARRLLKDTPEQLRAVTLEGEVFSASGTVVSGGGKAAGEQSALGRRRQRNALSKQAARKGEALEILERTVQELEAQRKELLAEGAQLEQALKARRQEEDKATQQANRQRLAAESAANQKRLRLEQHQQLQADIDLSLEEASQVSAKLKDLEGEIQAGKERHRGLSANLAELSLEEYQSQVTYWTTQAAITERLLAEALKGEQERKAALAGALKTQAGLAERLEALRESGVALESEQAERRRLESQLEGEIDALQALIEPAEAALEELDRQQAVQQTAEAAARQALNFAEHNHAQARIQLARRQEALESLRRRIEDDFGLVQLEYNKDVSGPTPLPLGDMVEQLPMIKELSAEIDEAIKRQRAQLRRMGAVNTEAQAEYQEVQGRFTFLNEQVHDLHKAQSDVTEVIAELDTLIQVEFEHTFQAVAEEFHQIFTRLFDGGSAKLVLTDPENLTETGIDIEARLPGRRTQGLSLLSGGERSLTAAALVFALLKVSPTPFCVLDEVDAMLDEANVGRYRELLRELSQNTQFVVVTHNRNTVQAADVIYGVTMGRDTASQVISLKLDEVRKIVE